MVPFLFYNANQFILFYINHVCFVGCALAEYLEHLKKVISVPFQAIVQFAIYFPCAVGSGIAAGNVF